MTLPKQIPVKFNADIYPHVRGDVVVLTNADLKEIDEIAEKRGIDEPYTVIKKGKGDTDTTPEPQDEPEAEPTADEGEADDKAEDGDKADAGNSDEPATEK